MLYSSRTLSHVAMTSTRNQGCLKMRALPHNERDIHTSKDISIVWFRTGDLRIHDHEPLCAACDQRNATVIPIVVEPEDDHIHSGMPSHRNDAVYRAIVGLEKALREGVGGLSLCILDKHEWHIALRTILGEAEGKRIDFHFYMSPHKYLDPKGYTLQEEMVGLLKEKGEVRIHPYWGKTLYHPCDMSSDHAGRPSISTYSMDAQFPGSLDLIASCENMTQFREKCQGTLPVREPREVPVVSSEVHDEDLHSYIKQRSIKHIDTRIREDIPIEEEDALEHLDSLLQNDAYMASYRTSRMSASTCERGAMLSTALSLGTLSPRMVYRKVHDVLRAKKQQQSPSWKWGPKVNSSSLGEEWLLMHLVIRDYFIYLAEYEGDQIYSFGDDREWSQDKDAFDLWISGHTGFPFVDASMRELRATGFMSNRARQNVASFLTKGLDIDWRWGEAYFQKTLIDHDSAVNAESWAYIAGVGPGRRDTKFMTVTQGETYDPEGTHIARWIPELRHLEPALRHRPWLSDQPLHSTPILPHESQTGKPPK